MAITIRRKGQLSFPHLSSQNIIFGPSNANDTLGTEDPYVVYREKDKTYYMFYVSVGSFDKRVCLSFR
jgi:predicted GH43/DUF377 family glycosyl hydrolase